MYMQQNPPGGKRHSVIGRRDASIHHISAPGGRTNVSSMPFDSLAIQNVKNHHHFVETLESKAVNIYMYVCTPREHRGGHDPRVLGSCSPRLSADYWRERRDGFIL